jgi:putative SbcD/Mre11-related phosphoesterase
MTNCCIDEDLILDARLALYHRAARWLAIADLHFGYEISQRAKGWLIPVWGMQHIEKRLNSLIADYQPTRVILVGDIVHSNIAQTEAEQFIEGLSKLGPELVLIRGNHDRGLRGVPLLDEFRLDGYHFQHGHQTGEQEAGSIVVEGHVHPTWRFSDGSGTRLRAPALVQMSTRLILPAFSPWAAGVRPELAGEYRLWVCAGSRVFSVERARRR